MNGTTSPASVSRPARSPGTRPPACSPSGWRRWRLRSSWSASRRPLHLGHGIRPSGPQGTGHDAAAGDRGVPAPRRSSPRWREPPWGSRRNRGVGVDADRVASMLEPHPGSARTGWSWAPAGPPHRCWCWPGRPWPRPGARGRPVAAPSAPFRLRGGAARAGAPVPVLDRHPLRAGAGTRPVHAPVRPALMGAIAGVLRGFHVNDTLDFEALEEVKVHDVIVIPRAGIASGSNHRGSTEGTE